jgi:hypothetical protein
MRLRRDTVSNDYRYSIFECDVIDKHGLERYRSKRREWLSWIETDNHHAIWKVLHTMIWADVSFRTFTHLAIRNNNSALHNYLLTDALFSGHIATQVLAIRRLIDKTKGVISLRRLVRDIRSNLSLLTRENYVCFDGLPFDYATVQRKEMLARAGDVFWWGDAWGPNAHGTSQMAHEQFDKLMGRSTGGQPQREDRIPTSILITLEKWLDDSGADELAKWSHSYLAHASIPERRKEIGAFQATTHKITKTIKNLTRVTEAISAHILFAGGRSGSLMPVAQFDQFEKLDQPVMRSGGEAEASEFWNKLSDEQNSYLDDLVTDLVDGAVSVVTNGNKHAS